jgi:hypothetical protein
MHHRAYLATVALIGASLLLSSGCGGPPPLHPIKGKITLGGKSYHRLIVYFRPVSGKVGEYNLGVGETDKDGNLTLRSSGGPGLMKGDYKVTFTCMVAPNAKGNVAFGSNEKPDDKGTVIMKELVPNPYDDKTSQESTPITFTVKSGENTFDFDIPLNRP